MHNHTKCFLEGKWAFEDGKSINAVPYQRIIERQSYLAWQRGWLSAKRQHAPLSRVA